MLDLPQQQCADGKDSPAGKKQHNLGSFYDTRKESVHHIDLRKLALRRALTTDLATGRGRTHLQGLISNSAAPKANARRATPVRKALSSAFMGLYSYRVESP